MIEKIVEFSLYFIFFIMGVLVFYIAFLVGRNTRYQDDNIPPPPNPITGKFNDQKSIMQIIRESVVKKKKDEAEVKARAGIINTLEEPDFTKMTRREPDA